MRKRGGEGRKNLDNHGYGVALIIKNDFLFFVLLFRFVGGEQNKRKEFSETTIETTMRSTFSIPTLNEFFLFLVKCEENETIK